jgi:hypothetical protein
LRSADAIIYSPAAMKVAGHGRSWRRSLTSAKLNGIDPKEYLTDVLERIVFGRTKINQFHELLPWRWKASRQAAAVKSAA